MWKRKLPPTRTTDKVLFSMDPEQIIANFLKPPSEGGAYTDEKLAALLAHAEDGKLAYASCCCLAGIPRAPHALQRLNVNEQNGHWDLPYTNAEWEADRAYLNLGDDDYDRRAKLIPLIKQEMSRRESLRAPVEVSEVVMA